MKAKIVCPDCGKEHEYDVAVKIRQRLGEDYKEEFTLEDARLELVKP